MKKKPKGMKFKTYLDKKLKDKKLTLAYEEASMHLRIARLIEELRLKEGLTQSDLAERSGVSQPMIARLENGDPNRIPTLSTINKVFRALGYEIDIHIKKVA